MRLHLNANGSLRSYSLKSFGGMRVVYGANGKFRRLSIPGPLGTRIFTGKNGELTGFGLPRMFGGFLLYDQNGKLKRSFSPSFGGVCISRDAYGNKKKHSVKGISRDHFLTEQIRIELPETQKTFTRKGEVTKQGIRPITQKDAKLSGADEKHPEDAFVRLPETESIHEKTKQSVALPEARCQISHALDEAFSDREEVSFEEAMQVVEELQNTRQD